MPPTTEQSLPLRPPTALVTGSSRGLGRGIAVELAAAGFSVAVHYAGNEEAARRTLDLCGVAASRRPKGSLSQRFEAFQCDLS
ncbi:MAG TPA: SDR family NAD(P)-dependent oxidoreductase, partial [Magnetospirillaceae bacterium]|nr:SDR family NAD(P)-dependent oxidoreductase [Magnetospirillaceae bacterium]